jgi:hypothetical protein
MIVRLLDANQRALTVAAVSLIAAVGLVGATLAGAARTEALASARTTARQQLASWVVPVEQFRADNGGYAGMTTELVARYLPIGGPDETWGDPEIAFASRNRYCIEWKTPPIFSRAGSLAPIVSGPCTRAATMAAPVAHYSSPPGIPMPASDTVFNNANRPPWAVGPRGYLWLLAKLTRPLMQGYWFEHGGTFDGATGTELLRTYGSPWFGLHPDLEIVTTTRTTYCATISFRGTTVALNGPSRRVTIGGCS